MGTAFVRDDSNFFSPQVRGASFLHQLLLKHLSASWACASNPDKISKKHLLACIVFKQHKLYAPPVG